MSIPESITALQSVDNLIMENHNVFNGTRETDNSVLAEINAAISYFEQVSADLQGHEMPSYGADQIVEKLRELHGEVEANASKIEELMTHTEGLHENFEEIIVLAGDLIAGG